MANESNILSASIELSLRSIQKGAKAIQQTVDNVNSAADFAQVKNEFSSLANRVVQAATTIQTEIGKITNTIDLSQVARNLQSLDTNVGKIVGSIDSYMEKMADSMADVNKVKLTEVQDQLADLQNSIKKFSVLIQSEDFLKAFKSDDVQKASSALRDYATALKNIATIDLSKLNSVLAGMGKDSEGSVIDLSPLAEQVRDFVDAMDGLTNVDRKITTLKNALDKLATFDHAANGNAFDVLSVSLDKIAEKAAQAAQAARGEDPNALLPDARAMETTYEQIKRISALMGRVFTYRHEDIGGNTTKRVVSLQSIYKMLERVNDSVNNLEKTVQKIKPETDVVGNRAEQVLESVKEKADQLTESLKKLKDSGLTTEQTQNMAKYFENLSLAESKLKEFVGSMLDLSKHTDKSTSGITTMMNSYASLGQVLLSLQEATRVTGNIVEQVGRKVGVSAASVDGATKKTKNLTTETKNLSKAQSEASSKTNGVPPNDLTSTASAIDAAIGRIVEGLTAVRSGSTKTKITIGQDVAAIATALKALSDEKQLDKFAQKLNGLSDGQVEQLTESFKKLTKEMTDVGNAVTNTFAGKTVSEVNNAKQQVVSFVSVLDRFKSNIDSFIMVDPSDATAGFANFAAELEKIGTLITRIFTDYESYEAALSGCTIDVKGQATFAEHIRKLSTETTTATINVEDFKNALQDVNVSENALNRVVAQTSGSFSASIKEMFSTDPAAAFIQDTNKYISKFRDLSQTSLTKANGFFTGFQNSGDMKQFAVNLQAVAQTLAAFDTKKLSELVAELHDLFAVKNEETGFSKIESSLTDLQKTAEKLEEIKTALGATDGITLADSMSAKLSESMTANLRDGLNGIAQAISSMGEAITHLDPERLRVVMDTISQLLNSNQNNTQGEHLLSVIKENINSSGTNISNIGAQAEASGEQVNQLENRITRLHNLQVTYGRDGSVTGAVATGWNEANRSITQYYNTAAQITSQVIRGTANQKSAVDEIVSLYKSAGTLISQSFSAKDEDLAADLYDQAIEKINQAEKAMDGLDDKRRNSAAILQAQADATNAYVKAQAAAVQAYRDATDKVAQKEADTEYKQSLAYEQDQIKGCIKALNEYHSLQKTQAKFKTDSPEFATLQEQINRAKASYDSYSDTVRNSVAVQNAWTEAEQKTSDALDNISAKQQSANQSSNLSDLISKTEEYWDLMAKAETATATVDKDEYTRRAQNLDAEIKGILGKNSALAQEQSYIDAATEAQKRYAAAVNSNSVATRQKEYNQLLEEQWSYEKRRLTLENQSDKGTSIQRAARQAEINRLRQEEERIAQEINSIDKAGLDTQTKLKQIQEQRVRLENDLSLKTGEVSEKLLNQIVQMAKTMIVARALRSIWTNAISYAKEYYDKMNEIQIVTMKTDSQIESLSQSYRNLAKDLKISSTDIATAAVEFWRQGLSEEETMSRTKWTSMYAKITSQSFDQAATQVTASTNSMKVSAQEVVDLFTYLGDASASSGEEIGTAMQKSAAAAAEFGLDFKHLGAYIAAVSETTRQEASSIGTSFNSIIARWHKIKSNGYVVEDDGSTTATNDVAKALGSKKVGISVFDNLGNWRDMSVVLDELAVKWGTLDSATRSYVATMIAGTTQQNTFLALMNDMSKGLDGGSRVYELYAGALEATGTVAEKYQVYLNSVAAAQDNMKVSLQNLYDTFMSGEIMKDFYNLIAEVASSLASGLNTLGKFPTKIIATTGALGGAALVLIKIVSVVKDLWGAINKIQGAKSIGAVLTGGNIGLLAVAAAGVASILISLIGRLNNVAKAKEAVNFDSQIETMENVVSKTKPLISEYQELAEKTNRTSEETDRMNELFTTISGSSYTFAEYLRGVGDSASDTAGNILKMNDALRDTEDALDIAKGSKAANKMQNVADNYGDLIASEEAYKSHRPATSNADTDLDASNFSAEKYGSEKIAILNWYSAIRNKYLETMSEQLNSEFDWKDPLKSISNYFGLGTNPFKEATIEEFGFAPDYDLSANGMQEGGEQYEKIKAAWEQRQAILADESASLIALNEEISQDLADDIDAMLNGLVLTDKRSEKPTLTGITDAQMKAARDKMIQEIQSRALNENLSDVVADVSRRGMEYLSETAGDTNYDLQYMKDYLTSWLGTSQDWADYAEELVTAGITTAQIDLARKNWDSLGVTWAGETLAKKMVGNVNTMNRKVIPESDLVKAGWINPEDSSDDGWATYYSSAYFLGNKHNWGDKIDFNYGQDAVLEITPILPDGSVLTPEELENYIQDVVLKGGNILENDKVENGGKGLVLNVASVENGEYESTLLTKGIGESLHEASAQFDNGGQSILSFIQSGQDAEGILAELSTQLAQTASESEGYSVSTASLTEGLDQFGVTQENIISLYQQLLPLIQNGSLAWSDIMDHLNNMGEDGFSGFLSWLTETITALTTEDLEGTVEGWTNLMNSFINSESLNEADSMNFIGELIPALEQIGDGAEESAESIMNFGEAYSRLTTANKKKIKGMIDVSDELWDKLVSGEELTVDEAEELISALNRVNGALKLKKLEDAGDITSGISDAFAAASKDLLTFNSKLTSVVSAVEKAKNAQLAYEYVLSNDKSAEYYSNAMSDLESYTGLSSEMIASNMDYVGQIIQAAMGQAEQSILDLCAELDVLNNKSVYVDPNGLLGLENEADVTTAKLATVINTILDAAGYRLSTVVDAKSGTGKIVVTKTGGGTYKPRTTGSSGSRGGRGGSGSKNNNSSKKDNSRTEEERWVEQINNTVKRITDRMSQLNTIMNSWDSEGYFTAEIKALGQVNEMLEDQDKILREKIAEAQARLPALIDQFNSTTPDTEAYDAILSRVNTIQDAITDWTQKLTENEASIVSNKQKIDDLNDSIRQLKLDLENEILEAIEDREQRIDDMLQARIDMEETILDILKAQAEDAEQAILDAIDAQIDALNKEKDAVSELLDARKEQADQEDKLAQLQELQAKYSRIVADPTRAKDAQDILDQINDLRDEIAWDQAENESEAQQKSIEQQISSLEDYRDYIEQYYEDLLNNPRNFIDQVNSILKMSQEDILTWLEQNSTDYKNSTDNTRTDMENGWKETLDTMNGIIHDHWQEVQDIISQGDEAVIAFLKENSNKYREASKLQQEAYIEGWQDMFDKIRKAYEDMQTNLLDNSKFINSTKWGGSDDDGSSSGSSGGGSSGGGGGGKKKYSATYPAIGSAKGGTLKGYDTEEAAIAAAKSKINSICRQLSGSSSSAIGQWARTFYDKITVKKYARGGIADFTGPIQIDGTKANPERILSATQTKLFEGLVASLEQMNRVRVAPMKYNGDAVTNSKSYGYNFGDINIKVERLDSDRDIEDLADKVKESIVESMTRGRAVGGIAL